MLIRLGVGHYPRWTLGPHRPLDSGRRGPEQVHENDGIFFFFIDGIDDLRITSGMFEIIEKTEYSFLCCR